MAQKEKQVKSYTRKSKSGKQVQVKSYSAKYNSAEDMVKEALKQKKGAGKELLETKKKQKVENIPDYDFSMDDFAHWYEGDGSKQDKAVEKSLRKILGKKNYEALNDYVADNYKKGGHKLAFKKVSSFKEGATTKDSKPKSAAAKKRDSTIAKLEKKLKTKGSLTNAEADALNKAKTAKRMGKDEYSAKDYVDFVNDKSSPKSKAYLEKIRKALVEKNGGTIDRGNKTSRALRKVEKELSKSKKPSKNSFDTKKEAVEFAKSKGLTINEYGTIMDGHKVLGSPIKSNGRWLIPGSIFRRKDKVKSSPAKVDKP